MKVASSQQRLLFMSLRYFDWWNSKSSYRFYSFDIFCIYLRDVL